MAGLGFWDVVPFDYDKCSHECLCKASINPKDNPTGLCDDCLSRHECQREENSLNERKA